jgi:CheY-like chemotaxis protein/HPt (histidine-containing phosphotransfer) domain-containing protein
VAAAGQRRAAGTGRVGGIVDAAPAALATPGQPHPLQGCRILLVEDNELNRIVATDLLEGAGGASVGVARNGIEALQRLDAEPFDLVLMDLQMPGMDGFETTQRLRERPSLARLPVIAMTAHAMARDRERCLAVGMNDFISKPFDPRDLFAALARALPSAQRTRRTGLPATTSPPDAPPGADAEAAVSFANGLQRCLGRQALYEKVVRQFVASHADELTQVQAAMADGRLDAVAALAHTTIAAAGAVGADGLSQVAREVQVAIRTRQLAPLSALLARYADQHGQAMQALRDYLARSV